MDSRHLMVGALIRDDGDRIFVQRRSESRLLFPGCWDIVGGSVEPGESLVGALRREIAEETGWQLERVLACLGAREWTVGGTSCAEVDFIVDVSGESSDPKLELDKHPEFSWVSAGHIGFLDESARRSGSPFIRDIVARAHRWLSDTPPELRAEGVAASELAEIEAKRR